MSVHDDLTLLLNAGRVDPILRDAVVRVEARVQELERENERLTRERDKFKRAHQVAADFANKTLIPRAEAAEAALAARTEQRDRVGKMAAEEAVARSKSEIALADMRRALEEAGGTLPDPMHPAFPPEFVDKQAAALAIIDRALAASEGTARGCAACEGDPEAHALHVCEAEGTAPSEGEA